MTLLEKIYVAIQKEYEERQKERHAHFGDKALGITDIAGVCEEKAILSYLGIEPPVKVEDIGALIHGTLLHEAIEGLITKHVGGEIEMEKEFGVKIHDWKIIGHPDVIYKDEESGVAEVYDFKFAHPFQIGKVIQTGKPSPQYKAQVILYQYLLKKHRIKTRTGYLEYISKVKSSVKVNNSKNERLDIGEFSVHEVEVPYDERVVRVRLNFAKDIIKDAERVAREVETIRLQLEKEYPELDEKAIDNMIIEKIKKGEIQAGMGVEETVEHLKKYYKAVGLDPEELDAEHYENWACRYCNYHDICPIAQAQRRLEENSAKKEDRGKEVSL